MQKIFEVINVARIQVINVANDYADKIRKLFQLEINKNASHVLMEGI